MLDIQSSESDEEEDEILSPKSSLIALQKQYTKKSLISKWLNVLNSGIKQPQSVNDQLNLGLNRRVHGLRILKGIMSQFLLL